MLNQIVLMGNIVRKSEEIVITGGKSRMFFTIAVDASTEKEKKSDFIKCSIWETKAETFHKHVEVGQKMVVSGRLKPYKVTKNNETHDDYLVEVNNFYFAGQKPSEKKSDEIDIDSIKF